MKKERGHEMTKTERKRREIAARKLDVLDRRLTVAWTRYMAVLQDSQEKSEQILSPFFEKGLKIGVVDSDGVVYNDDYGNTYFPDEIYAELTEDEDMGEEDTEEEADK